MSHNLRRLAKSRELLYMLTWRDIRIRYKQSIMGFLWAILMPSLIVGAGALVRVGAAKFSGTSITSNDIASVMVRAVAWAFFIAALRFGTGSLIANPNLVTKISFPKEVFPLAAVFSNLFDFVVATAAVLVTLLFIGWHPTFESLLALPLFIVLVAFTLGLSLLLSAGNLFFRDVKYLVEIVLTYAIFFTPVLYDASVVGKWRSLIMINPVSPVLEGISSAMVTHEALEWNWIGYSAAVSFFLLIAGYWAFKQLEERFAERI